MLGFWETGRALTAPRAAEQVSSSLQTCVSPVPDLQGRDTVVTCKTLVSAGPNIRTETRKKQSSAYCNRELLPHLQHIFNTACCVLLHCFFFDEDTWYEDRTAEGLAELAPECTQQQHQELHDAQQPHKGKDRSAPLEPSHHLWAFSILCNSVIRKKKKQKWAFFSENSKETFGVIYIYI